MSPLSLFTGPYAFLARMGVFFLTLFIAIAFGFYEGWKWERPAVKVAQDKLTTFTAQVKTLGETAQKATDARKLADQQAKKDADHDHQADVAKLATAWAAEYDRLRKQSASHSGSGPASAVAVSSHLSCSAAANNQLSSAVSDYITAARSALAECRGAVDEFRSSVAQQLEQADRNTEALVCGVRWAAKTLH